MLDHADRIRFDVFRQVRVLYLAKDAFVNARSVSAWRANS